MPVFQSALYDYISIYFFLQEKQLNIIHMISLVNDSNFSKLILGIQSIGTHWHNKLILHITKGHRESWR